MCVRWLATVRSPRNNAAATSRFVRPSATSAATRCSAGVRPSSRVRPPMLPSSATGSARPRSRRRAARSRRAPPRSRRAPRASAGRACGRRRERAAPGPVRRDRRPRRAARPRRSSSAIGLVESPRAAAIWPRHRIDVREDPPRPTRLASASHRSRTSTASSIRPSSNSASTYSSVHRRTLGSHHPSSARRESRLANHSAAVAASPRQRATSPMTAR